MIGAFVVLLAVEHAAHGDALEPPPEAAPDADYELERADSLADGDVEVGMSVAGRDGGHAARRRHARFHSDSLDGAVREGAGDALAGASLEGTAGGGRYGVGRVLPTWGRGLALGDTREPWGWRERVLRRRAGGDVAWYRAGDRRRIEAWGGSVAGRTRAGFGAAAGGAGAALFADRAGVARGSLWGGRETQAGAASYEIAVDRRGRWRGEVATVERDSGARLSAWVRAGLAGFRGLGDPARAGPPAALSVRADTPLGRGGVTHAAALGALWRFAPGIGGARATLEVEHAFPHHASVVGGFEEQHGTRRDPGVAAPAAADLDRFRQGVWVEGHAASGPVTLGWRHERWGARRWVRGEVRAMSTAHIGVESESGLAVRLTHATFRARRGEHVYLPEIDSDRLVLRALAGDGERTRVELHCPFAGGMVGAALNRTWAQARTPGLQWTLEWTRRARIMRGPHRS